METGKIDVNNLNYLQRLPPHVYPSSATASMPSSVKPGAVSQAHLQHQLYNHVQLHQHHHQQQQQQHQHQQQRLHQAQQLQHQQQQQQAHLFYYNQQQQHQLIHQKQTQPQPFSGPSHLTQTGSSNFTNHEQYLSQHGHQGNFIGHQGQPGTRGTTIAVPPVPSVTNKAATHSSVVNNCKPTNNQSVTSSSNMVTSPSTDMELESMIVLFIEKRKELNQSLAKVEALSRQLEELKSGIDGSANYRIPNNPSITRPGDKFDELERLRQELATQTRLNEQQNVTLMHKQSLLMQRKCEIAGIDERITELQKRLAMKRMLNQQLSNQMKTRTGVAYGVPNDSLNSGNPRLRSSVGPCNTIRPNNTYNRTNVNANVAAVEPFQRSTLPSNENHYGTNSYEKSDENHDPLGDLSPSKQHISKYHNLPYRNKYSPVELNSKPYPPSNNPETTTSINNKANFILNSQQKSHQDHYQHQHHQQQMPLQRQPQQQYAPSAGNHNVNLSLANSENMRSHNEVTERPFAGNGTGDLVGNRGGVISEGGGESFLVSPLKQKIHLRERPSPSGSSSSSSDQLPAGYSPAKKVLDVSHLNGNSNESNHILSVNGNGNIVINNTNHKSNKAQSNNSMNHPGDYYGLPGGENESVNCEFTPNMGKNLAHSYHCSPESGGFEDINSAPNEQIIDSIRKNTRLANHHNHQRPQQSSTKPQSELIEKCAPSELPNKGNNNQNGSSLNEDDQSSLSGPSITSSGSQSSAANQQQPHHQQLQPHQLFRQQQSNLIFNDDTNSHQQIKGNNLRKSVSSSNVPNTLRLPSNCGSICRSNQINQDPDEELNHRYQHHYSDSIDRNELTMNKSASDQLYHHRPAHHQLNQQQPPQYHQQSNSFMRNGLTSSNNHHGNHSNQESPITSSFYDYSPTPSSNDIYSCSIDVTTRSLTNDANSSLTSSITTSISSSSSSSVPQQQQQQQSNPSISSSSSTSPYGNKNGYPHPSSSSSSSSTTTTVPSTTISARESVTFNRNQKSSANNQIDNHGTDETMGTSSERTPPTGMESNNSNHSFQSINQVNNKHHLNRYPQPHHHQQEHHNRLQHEDDVDADDDYEEDIEKNDSNGNDDNDRNLKPSECRSSSNSVSGNNHSATATTNESSMYSRGDEIRLTDLANEKGTSLRQEKDNWYNNSKNKINQVKRRPMMTDNGNNKMEKELGISSASRKPLAFKWPPPPSSSSSSSPTHTLSRSSKSEEGKKVTWAKKKILSKTTDDLRSSTKDVFGLESSSYIRPLVSSASSNDMKSSILKNKNHDSKLENDLNHQTSHLHHHHLHPLDKTTTNSGNSNPCNKVKSSLKKEDSVPNPKKDHERLTKRVSFDPLALLLDAALEGELDLVKKTSQIQDVSAANDEGITALHNTICAGHFDIVKYLVEIGCDVNAPDSDGWTPLHCAASCNNLTMVKYLVEHGACIFATTFPDKETAAQKCEEGEEGFEECSKYLLHIQDTLGNVNEGVVYAVFDYDAQSSDELSFKCGDALTILRRDDEKEKDWWWARFNDKEGYVPRNLLALTRTIKPNKESQHHLNNNG